MCTPLGICTNCNVGSCKFCLSERNDSNTKTNSVKEVQYEREFVVLPKSKEKPILGIQTIRDLDLAGQHPLLFRTADALAKQPAPIVSAGDVVTSQKKTRRRGLRKHKKCTPPSAWNNVKGPQGFCMGVREAMESRRILTVGKRRIGGKWHPADNAGLHGRKKKKLGVRKRKLRELVGQRLATLIKNLPGDDGIGQSGPTSSESDLEADAILDGTIFHRDELFDVAEADLEAAEAEEAWMEKRELLFEEASTDPLAQIKIEGSPTLQRQVTEVCQGLREVFRAQVRPEPAQFREPLNSMSMTEHG